MGRSPEQPPRLVRPGGRVTAVDISPEMLMLAKRRIFDLGLTNVEFREGRAEAIPVEDGVFDVLLASLSLMYVIERGGAAREVRRVLRPGGRLVAALWAGPDKCDIVLFQQTSGRFAPARPVPGSVLGCLRTRPASWRSCRTQALMPMLKGRSWASTSPISTWRGRSWPVLLPRDSRPIGGKKPGRRVQAVMWPGGRGPRHFRNVTRFLIGHAVE
jgi:SAM-dependent methyltransferase